MGYLCPGDMDRYANRLGNAAQAVSSSGTWATDEFR
jgi:hypothetical protein